MDAVLVFILAFVFVLVLMVLTETDLVKTGTILAFAGTTAPKGYLLCNGSLVSKIQYPHLHGVIGTSYGLDADDTNLFAVPDLRGRMIVGTSSSFPRTSTGGSATHILTIPQLPTHDHTATTAITGAHTHSITDAGHTHTSSSINDDFNSSGIPSLTGTPSYAQNDSTGNVTWNNISTSTTGISVDGNGAHSHTVNVATNGASEEFSIMNPYMSTNYIIKA
jgi:microcystin-dependent protein